MHKKIEDTIQQARIAFDLKIVTEEERQGIEVVVYSKYDSLLGRIFLWRKEGDLGRTIKKLRDFLVGFT